MFGARMAKFSKRKGSNARGIFVVRVFLEVEACYRSTCPGGGTPLFSQLCRAFLPPLLGCSSMQNQAHSGPSCPRCRESTPRCPSHENLGCGAPLSWARPRTSRRKLQEEIPCLLLLTASTTGKTPFPLSLG